MKKCWQLSGLESDSAAAAKQRNDFFGVDGPGEGFTDSRHLNSGAEIENLGTLLDSLERMKVMLAKLKPSSTQHFPTTILWTHIPALDADDITSEQGRLDGIAQSLTGAKEPRRNCRKRCVFR